MTKNSFVKEIPMILVMLIPFFSLLILWNDIPEQVPIHWNMENEIDNYVSKFPGLFILPVINIGIYLLFLGIPRIDPRWRDSNLFSKTFYWLRFGVVLFMVLVWSASIFSVFGIDLNIGLLVIFLINTILLGIGITMPKIKQNPYIGIRLSWTLDSEDNWNKTHKFASWVWIFGSILMYAIIFLIDFSELILIFIGCVVLLVVLPVLYSYYHRESDK